MGGTTVALWQIRPEWVDAVEKVGRKSLRFGPSFDLAIFAADQGLGLAHAGVGLDADATNATNAMQLTRRRVVVVAG